MTGIVRGEYKQLGGAVAAGQLVITVNTEGQVVRDPVGNVVFQGPQAVKLNKDGLVTLTLPASDDSTLEPSGFTYAVVEQLSHVARTSYRIVEFQVTNGGTIQLADLAATDEAALDPSYGANLNAVLAELDGRLSEGDLAASIAAGVAAGVPPLLAAEVGPEVALQLGSVVAVSPLTIVLGDSIDSGEDCWFNVAARASQQRIRNLRNSGIGGNTTTQMLARIQTDVIAYAPANCIIGGPTNDIGNSLSEATTKQNYAAIIAALRAAGIRPIMRTAPPRDVVGTGSAADTVAKVRAATERSNAWKQDFCQANRIDLIDIYGQLVDPLTRGYKTGLTSDGIHPTPAAHTAVGSWVAANLPPSFATAAPPILTSAKGSTANAVQNGIFSGAGPKADGFYSINTLGFNNTTGLNIAAVGGGVPGNWQGVNASAGGTGDITVWESTALADTGLVVGDKFRIKARAEITIAGSITVSVRFKDSGGAIIGLDQTAVENATGVPTGSYVYGQGTVPAGAVTIEPRFMVAAGGAARFAQFTVEKIQTA